MKTLKSCVSLPDTNSQGVHYRERKGLCISLGLKFNSEQIHWLDLMLNVFPQACLAGSSGQVCFYLHPGMLQ